MAEEYVPSGHGMQEVAPGTIPYMPAGQLVHDALEFLAVADAGLYVPAAHIVQPELLSEEL